MDEFREWWAGKSVGSKVGIWVSAGLALLFAIALAGDPDSDSGESADAPPATTTVVETQPADEPEPEPRDLTFRITREPAERVRRSSIVLAGVVTGGSQVFVNDEPARVSGRRWRARVPLDLGDNDIVIEAERRNFRSTSDEIFVERLRKRRPKPSPEPEPRSRDTEVDEPEDDAGSSGCDPNYSGCVPVFPPDVNCADVDGPVSVKGSDPHGLDGDNDGTGCE